MLKVFSSDSGDDVDDDDVDVGDQGEQSNMMMIKINSKLYQ